MKHPSTRVLFEYWNRLRRDRAAPERNDVDPSEIRNVLIDTFVLEVDAARSFPMRLVGDRTNCLFLDEMKGRDFMDLWQAEDRDDLDLLISAVLDDSVPVVAGARATAMGRQPVNLELLLLPLRHNGRTHARMLGCLAPHTIPSWFGLLPSGPLALGSMRTLESRSAGDDAADAPAAATGTDDTARVSRRGHLLVFEGGL